MGLEQVIVNTIHQVVCTGLPLFLGVLVLYISYIYLSIRRPPPPPRKRFLRWDRLGT